MKGAFVEIEKEFKGKKLAAAIYNVGGKFVRKPFLELSLEDYEAGYEANGLDFPGSLLATKIVLTTIVI